MGGVWGMCGCVRVCVGVSRFARVCASVHRWVCVGGRGSAWVCVYGYGQVCAGMGGCRCAWVCACVWDEFSEFLLENRVPTSADFNTYPIRIFIIKFSFQGPSIGRSAQMSA